MKLFKVIGLVLLTGICFQVAASAANKKDFVKIYKKEFNGINANTTVGLNNRYGKVEVRTWDKNQVYVTVKITAHASNQKEAEEVIDRIKISFTSGADFVKTETSIEDRSSVMTWFSGNSCDYTIDYEVFMPPANKLDLKNKYGNSYVSALNGAASVDVKYGDFKVENIAGAFDVKLGYGNGTIVKCNNLKCAVSYGNIRLDDARDVDMQSKYSEITLTEASDVKIDSHYDDYTVGTVRELRINSEYGDYKINYSDNLIVTGKYTDYQVKKLANNADMDLQYGGLQIGSLSKGFSNINVRGSYTDVEIKVEEGANYHLDAVTNYADISAPVSLKASMDKEKGTSREINGFVGNTNTKSVIKARLNYGDLSIR